MNIDIEPIIEDSENFSPEESASEAVVSENADMAEKDQLQEPELSPEAYRPIISLKHVDIYQKDILILSDVNLTVEKGEWCIWLARPAAGKAVF